MNAYDLLTKNLNTLTPHDDDDNARLFLKSFISQGSQAWGTSAYGHDSSPSLVFKRVLPNLVNDSKQVLLRQSHLIIQEFFKQPHANNIWAFELFHIAAMLDNKTTVDLLVSKVDFYYKLNPKIVQIILGILVDSPTKQSVEFWKRMTELNPREFTGFAINALLDLDIDSAVNLIPSMMKSRNTAMLISMIVGLAYDGMTDDQRKVLVDKVGEHLPSCPPDHALVLKRWYDARSHDI